MVTLLLAAALLAQEPMAHRDGAETTFNIPRTSFGCALTTDAGLPVTAWAEISGSQTTNLVGFRGSGGAWPGLLVFRNVRPLSSDTSPSAFRISLRGERQDAGGPSRVEVVLTMGIPAGAGVLLTVNLTHGDTSARGACQAMPRFTDPIDDE
jgi:hypothetical protein